MLVYKLNIMLLQHDIFTNFFSQTVVMFCDTILHIPPLPEYQMQGLQLGARTFLADVKAVNQTLQASGSLTVCTE